MPPQFCGRSQRRTRFARLAALAAAVPLLAAASSREGVKELGILPTDARRPIVAQLAKLTASDAGLDDNLGFSVAMAGDTIAAGAKNADAQAGIVFVFVKPPGGWVNATETARLTPSDNDGSDLLGWSVATNGSIVVGGAPGADAGKGAAYVFVRPGGG